MSDRHVASVPILKFAALKCGRNRDTRSLFSVACLSPPFVAKCDELRGQDTRSWLSLVLAMLMLLSPAGATAAAPIRDTTHRAATASHSATAGETIVFFRHGEKPSAGLGQLDCQGLNRALQLPKVLANDFGSLGKPAAIFAPDPAQQIDDGGKKYYYVRPLATIEPTAIRLGMPVNAQFGYADIDALHKALLGASYQNSLVYVAWEHKKLIELVQDLVKQGGGDPSKLPAWPDTEFDMILVLHVTQNGGAIKVTWEKKAEGLNNLPTSCPSQSSAAKRR